MNVTRRAIFALVAVLFASVSAAFAANGDILAVQIQPDGWRAYVYFTGRATSGSFSNGLSPMILAPTGHERLTLSVTGSVIGEDLKPTDEVRAIFGKDMVRLPYPNQTSPDIDFDNNLNRTRIIVSLTHTVYSNETAIAQIRHGLFRTDLLTNSAVSNLHVSNLSTQQYVKAYARWLMAPLEEQTNDTVQLGLFAIGAGAREGRPVRAVEMWVTDDHGNISPTTLVTRATYVPAVACQKPLGIGSCQYVGNVNITNLASGDSLACHARVYPWQGDSSAALASDDGNPFPDERFCNWKLFNNRNGARWHTVAHIDPVNGVDTLGQAWDQARYSEAVPHPFATLSGAMTAICRTNWMLHKEANVELSILYLTNGIYSWSGTFDPIITNDTIRTWVQIIPAPGVTRDQVVFTKSGNSRRVASAVKVSNCTISFQNGGVSEAEHLLFENCNFTNVTSMNAIGACFNLWFLRNRVSSLPYGLMPASNTSANFRMVGENDFSDFSGMIWPSCVFANFRGSGTNGAARIIWPSNPSFVEFPNYPFVGFNAFFCEYAPTAGHLLRIAEFGSTVQCTNGVAVVQNIIEQVSNSSNAVRTASISSSSTSIPDTNAFYNAYVVNNTFVGQRANLAEGGGYQTGVQNISKSQVFAWNNLCDNLNSKDDLDYNPNSSKTNAWEMMYTVNWSGDVDLEPVDMDSAWHWGSAVARRSSTNHFALNSYFSGGFFGHGSNADWYLYPQFVNPKRGFCYGTNLTEGAGDYHLKDTSPLWVLKTLNVFPFDLYGEPRFIGGPPGALGSIHTYPEWAASILPVGQSDPAADPDGDGIPNAVEFAFGTDPLTPNRPPLRCYSNLNFSSTQPTPALELTRSKAPTDFKFEIVGSSAVDFSSTNTLEQTVEPVSDSIEKISFFPQANSSGAFFFKISVIPK